MKKMLITATAVGAAIAGLVLYARKRGGKELPSRTDAFKDVNLGIGNGNGRGGRNALHSMG